MALGVHSEVGRLRQAIVHRPGLELSRLTPDTIEALLFDDILWAERAREEHWRDHGTRLLPPIEAGVDGLGFEVLVVGRVGWGGGRHGREGWHRAGQGQLPQEAGESMAKLTKYGNYDNYVDATRSKSRIRLIQPRNHHETCPASLRRLRQPPSSRSAP